MRVSLIGRPSKRDLAPTQVDHQFTHHQPVGPAIGVTRCGRHQYTVGGERRNRGVHGVRLSSESVNGAAPSCATRPLVRPPLQTQTKSSPSWSRPDSRRSQLRVTPFGVPAVARVVVANVLP